MSDHHRERRRHARYRIDEPGNRVDRRDGERVEVAGRISLGEPCNRIGGYRIDVRAADGVCERHDRSAEVDAKLRQNAAREAQIHARDVADEILLKHAHAVRGRIVGSRLRQTSAGRRLRTTRGDACAAVACRGSRERRRREARLREHPELGGGHIARRSAQEESGARDRVPVRRRVVGRIPERVCAVDPAGAVRSFVDVVFRPGAAPVEPRLPLNMQRDDVAAARVCRCFGNGKCIAS